MENLEQLGFCGVNCAACTDFTDGKCPGCRQTQWPEGDACMPVACCTEKKIAVCGLCPQFPCRDMAEFYEESDGHREAYERMRALSGEN